MTRREWDIISPDSLAFGRTLTFITRTMCAQLARRPAPVGPLDLQAIIAKPFFDFFPTFGEGTQGGGHAEQFKPTVPFPKFGSGIIPHGAFGFYPITPADSSVYILCMNPSSQGNGMSKSNSIIAIYPSHMDAAAAIKELQHSGFDMERLSIVGRDYPTDEHVVGYYNIGDRMKAWGKAGAFWGGLGGILFGSVFFWIPGVGPLLVAGPLVDRMTIGALEGAVVVGGLSAIGAGLNSPGVPRGSIVPYETTLKTGKSVLIVHGVQGDTTDTKEILGRTMPERVEHLPEGPAEGSES